MEDTAEMHERLSFLDLRYTCREALVWKFPSTFIETAMYFHFSFQLLPFNFHYFHWTSKTFRLTSIRLPNKNFHLTSVRLPIWNSNRSNGTRTGVKWKFFGSRIEVKYKFSGSRIEFKWKWLIKWKLNGIRISTSFRLPPIYAIIRGPSTFAGNLFLTCVVDVLDHLYCFGVPNDETFLSAVYLIRVRTAVATQQEYSLHRFEVQYCLDCRVEYPLVQCPLPWYCCFW